MLLSYEFKGLKINEENEARKEKRTKFLGAQLRRAQQFNGFDEFIAYSSVGEVDDIFDN